MRSARRLHPGEPSSAPVPFGSTAGASSCMPLGAKSKGAAGGGSQPALFGYRVEPPSGHSGQVFGRQSLHQSGHGTPPSVGGSGSVSVLAPATQGAPSSLATAVNGGVAQPAVTPTRLPRRQEPGYTVSSGGSLVATPGCSVNVPSGSVSVPRSSQTQASGGHNHALGGRVESTPTFLHQSLHGDTSSFRTSLATSARASSAEALAHAASASAFQTVSTGVYQPNYASANHRGHRAKEELPLASLTTTRCTSAGGRPITPPCRTLGSTSGQKGGIGPALPPAGARSTSFLDAQAGALLAAPAAVKKSRCIESPAAPAALIREQYMDVPEESWQALVASSKRLAEQKAELESLTKALRLRSAPSSFPLNPSKEVKVSVTPVNTSLEKAELENLAKTQHMRSARSITPSKPSKEVTTPAASPNPPEEMEVEVLTAETADVAKAPEAMKAPVEVKAPAEVVKARPSWSGVEACSTPRSRGPPKNEGAARHLHAALSRALKDAGVTPGADAPANVAARSSTLRRTRELLRTSVGGEGCRAEGPSKPLETSQEWQCSEAELSVVDGDPSSAYVALAGLVWQLVGGDVGYGIESGAARSAGA